MTGATKQSMPGQRQRAGAREVRVPSRQYAKCSQSQRDTEVKAVAYTTRSILTSSEDSVDRVASLYNALVSADQLEQIPPIVYLSTEATESARSAKSGVEHL